VESLKQRRPVGSLQISQDVIATIAGVAAQEIPGVGALTRHAPGFGHNPLKKQRGKPVDVLISDGCAEIDIGLSLQYGAKINAVCTAVQTAVKDNVQTMTGMAVSKVNVFVSRMVFSDGEKPSENG